MSHPSSPSERLNRAFANPGRGVLGLVDELLSVSLEHGFQLAWRDGRCHIRFIEDGSVGRIEVPVPRSVVRAALARIAALCNAQIPNSVSPYGGMGEVSFESDPAKMIRATYINTPEEQSLEIAPVKPETSQQGCGQPLAIMPAEARPR